MRRQLIGDMQACIQSREVMYFDGEGARLFGVYDQPAAQSAGDAGVVICPPIGREYWEYHKLTVRLGEMFAARGLACMRFDYSGCGDSAGEMESCSISQWLSDIGSAVEALKRKANVHEVCLCGLSFGASLAAAYGAKEKNVARMVLWRPVVDGREYAKQLARAHKRWLRGSFAKAERIDKKYCELGFPARPPLRDELEQVRLLDLTSPSADEMLVVCQETEQAAKRMSKLAPKVDVVFTVRGAMPLRAMDTMVRWAAERVQ